MRYYQGEEVMQSFVVGCGICKLQCHVVSLELDRRDITFRLDCGHYFRADTMEWGRERKE